MANQATVLSLVLSATQKNVADLSGSSGVNLGGLDINSLSSNITNGMLSQASSLGSSTISSIQGNTTGRYNPLNLSGGNLNPSQITSVISPSITPSLSGFAGQSFISSISNAVPGLSPALLARLASSISGNYAAAASAAVLSFANGLIPGGSPAALLTTLTGTTSLFSEGTVDQQLDQISQLYDGVIVKDGYEAAKTFNPSNVDNQKKLANLPKGFTDPEAVYPKPEYAGETDTNKLARGIVKDTIVPQKFQDRVLGSRLPNGLYWDEPEPAFNARYPYNQVIQTQSGHIIEIDDTPNSERLHIYHKAGSFVEIDKFGTIVMKSKGSQYQIIDKNGYVTVAGALNLTVNGDCQLFVGNDCKMEVDGDLNIVSHNDIVMQAAGRVQIAGGEGVDIHGLEVRVEAETDVHVFGDDNIKMATDAMNIIAVNEYVMESKSTSIYGEEEAILSSSNKTSVKGDDTLSLNGSLVSVSSDSRIYLNAAGAIAGDASAIYWNSGVAEATPPTGAYDAVSAGYSLVGFHLNALDDQNNPIVARKYIDRVSIEDLKPFNSADKNVEVGEGFIPTDAEAKARNDAAISSGALSSSELERSPAEAPDPVSPKSNNTTVILPSENIKNLTKAPGNYELSPHFTLEMLTTHTAVSSYPLKPQKGRTYGELLYSLAGIALNILEPVKALYPDLFITSAFRHDEKYPNSPHALGEAIDLQFRKASYNDYIKIAEVLARELNYDQILLEYQTANGKGMPWIHIGFSSLNKNRQQILTFNNHKVYDRSQFIQVA